MPLRIACDLDGTLADMESALQREAERLFGPEVDLRAGGRIPVTPDDLDESDATPAEAPAPVPESPRRTLTGPELRRLWTYVRQIDNFWTTLDEIETGSVRRLAALATQHGWEVMFLTRRPSTMGETAQVQTQRWLKAHGFELPSVFVMHGSRGRVAEAFALDVVVDDRPENAVDVAIDSRARAILVWREDPGAVPAAASGMVDVVFSFSDAVDILERMSAPPTRSERLMKRVRSAIGI